MPVLTQTTIDWTGRGTMAANTPKIARRRHRASNTGIVDYVDVGPFQGERPKVILTTGSSRCQCGRCGLAFTSVRGFDTHQRLVDGAVVCLSPETVGLVFNDGWWSFPPDPRFAK
jgi:hypothetical protein